MARASEAARQKKRRGIDRQGRKDWGNTGTIEKYMYLGLSNEIKMTIISCIPKCQHFGCHFSEANVRGLILVKPLIWDLIITIFSCVEKISIEHVSREANQMAHVLARRYHHK